MNYYLGHDSKGHIVYDIVEFDKTYKDGVYPPEANLKLARENNEMQNYIVLDKCFLTSNLFVQSYKP